MAHKGGFGDMDDKEEQKRIASKGGKAAHKKGTAHKLDPSKASEYGRLGGLATSKNREHMSKIGRRGGERSSKKKYPNRPQDAPIPVDVLERIDKALEW
jgi:uncharacterized protein